MAIQFGAKAFIQEIGKYGFGVVTGGGIVLTSLLAWTGADNLQSIKDAVNQFEQVAEQQVSYLVGEYEVTVDNANAEIGEYKDALAQANSNIDKLITAYEQQELAHQQELKELQNSMVSVDEANEIIAKANEEIGQANQQVESTRQEVQNKIIGSNIVKQTAEQRLADTEKQLDITTGEPTVKDIPSNIEIPTEQQGENN